MNRPIEVPQHTRSGLLCCDAVATTRVSTPLTNAIIVWSTTYLGAAIEHMDLPNSVVEHHAPSISRQIHLYGQYDFTSPKPPASGTLRALNTTVVTKPQS